eukprot:TRINITY_DN8565_c0_g2_i3.p1 TRINITY_DN8565_c0_g2~~TRINITY_DN8565_c0_g2_i3.p1  ORF type:complete len:292 (+),score=49.28 TRINITY_DN8565_c0_g2_i3:221-1096(+)
MRRSLTIYSIFSPKTIQKKPEKPLTSVTPQTESLHELLRASILPYCFQKQHLAKSNPSSILNPKFSSPVYENPAKVKKLTGIQRRSPLLGTSILFRDQITPKAPKVVEAFEDSFVFNRLRFLFNERPIWLRNVILSEIKDHKQDHKEEFSEYKFKKYLSALGYSFKDGPWKFTYIRYGYDPRTDPSAFKYQIVDVGVIKREDYQNKMFEKNSFIVYNPRDFSQVVKYRQLYQICDLEDEVIKSILQSQEARISNQTNLKCDKSFGWLDRAAYRSINKQIKEKMKKMDQTAV